MSVFNCLNFKVLLFLRRVNAGSKATQRPLQGHTELRIYPVKYVETRISLYVRIHTEYGYGGGGIRRISVPVFSMYIKLADPTYEQCSLCRESRLVMLPHCGLRTCCKELFGSYCWSLGAS